MKTRLLTSGYYDPNPQYKRYTLKNWPFIMPCLCSLEGGKDIKDTYHYYAWRPGNHRGIDILGRIGNPIFAVGAGTVWARGYDETYGYNVILKHGLNSGFYIYTRYGHLNSINYMVKTGAKVTKGQSIGYMGTTGDSLSPHLHFEFLIHGWMLAPDKMRAVDPLPFLPRAEVVERLIEDDTHGLRFEEI